MIKNLSRLISSFAFLVLVLMLMRIGWFLGFKPSLLVTNNLLHAFITGLRFDLAASAYGLLIPLLLLPFIQLVPKSYNKKVSFFVLYGFSLLIILINSSDISFYSFFREHINLIFFGLVEDDTAAVITTVWKEYNVPFHLMWISLAFYTHYRLFKWQYNLNLIQFKPNKIKSTFLYILTFIMLAIFGRGNFNNKPLSYEEAHFSNDTFVNHIALNGIFSLYRAVKVRSKLQSEDFDLVEELGFKGRETEAFKILFNKDVKNIEEGLALLKKKTDVNKFIEKNKPNIVVILSESFGSFWLRYENQKLDFLGSLKKHIEEDFYFQNGLSSENGTIGSLVSLIVGQTYRPGSVVLSESRYSFVKIGTAIHLPYERAGYDTSFLYGGKLGWRDIGRYVKVQGYKNIYGQKYLLDKFNVSDVGNEWGVFDQYLFQASLDQLKNSKKPVFQLIMTTSNHPPYDIPISYEPLPLEIPESLKNRLARDYEYSMKRFKAYQYANDQLGKYLSKIKNSALGKKTIVVFSGDHNFWGITQFSPQEKFMKHTVPYYFYIPKAYQSKEMIYNRNSFISAQDIIPSIAPYSLSNESYTSVGVNVFSDVFRDQSYTTNSSGIFADNRGVYFSENFYKWKSDFGQEIIKSDLSLQKLKDKYHALLTITELYLRTQKSKTKQQ